MCVCARASGSWMKEKYAKWGRWRNGGTRGWGLEDGRNAMSNLGSRSGCRVRTPRESGIQASIAEVSIHALRRYGEWQEGKENRVCQPVCLCAPVQEPEEAGGDGGEGSPIVRLPGIKGANPTASIHVPDVPAERRTQFAGSRPPVKPGPALLGSPGGQSE